MEHPRFPVDAAPARARAAEIIKRRSFKYGGEYRLASGETSNFYLDMKPTMFDPEGVRLLAQLVLGRIASLGVDFVGGLEMGAVPLVAPVAMLSAATAHPIAGFFVRKAAKSHGMQKRVEAPDGALAGRRVVILEDVTTTGDSAMQAAQAAREVGADVALVLSIVDRQGGAARLFERAGIPFDSIFQAREFLPA
jgi:orotate phosphoribosyltransferase